MPGDDELLIRAHARVLGGVLSAGEEAVYKFEDGQLGYLVSAGGSVQVNGVRVNARDGLAISGEKEIKIQAIDEAEVVLVVCSDR